MATMNCECGETVTGDDNHLLEAYRQHQESHLPSTQAEWSIAYQNMLDAATWQSHALNCSCFICKPPK